MFLNSKSLLLILPFAFALSACGSKGGSPVSDKPRHTKEVNRKTFINGKTFCAMYSNIDGAEYGKWVAVPKHYDNPSAGTLNIYVFSKTPFNPNLPTYLFVDGGPGQNTHTEHDYLSNSNQLQFDQRGLGCSTPDDFDTYSDPSLYSSDNTVQDMEEIRKAYGVDQITVYGISYGTVPATMYGAKFSAHTRSVVLEGVLGTMEHMHSPAYKAEKFNLAMSNLNTAQRAAVGSHMNNNDDNDVLKNLFQEVVYEDDGFSSLQKILNALIYSDGSINQTVYNKIKGFFDDQDSKYSTPQQPMGVDENIFLIVSCKNLGFRDHQMTLDFSEGSGQFYARSLTSKEKAAYAAACDKVGVNPSDSRPYQISSYAIAKPVYYFQGSHDGACNAEGAFEHWRTVPKGKSYFMLASHGGHNPNLSRLRGEATASNETDLFYKAITAVDLSSTDFNSINTSQTSTNAWIFFGNGYNSTAETFLSGI